MSPEPIYGLILTESKGLADAIDYVFKACLSRSAHVGPGQLSRTRLPKRVPGRVQAAFAWQETRDPDDLERWKALDKRFDPRWNIATTVREFYEHIMRTGDPTFAFMGHHGGGGDPVRAIQLYAQDHGVRLKRSEVADYTYKHHITYFTLYEARGSAYHYWAAKSDSHVTYGFAPVAWAEIFARWCDAHPEKLEQVQLATLAKAKETKTKEKIKHGGKEEMVTLLGFVRHYVVGITHDAGPACAGFGMWIGQVLLALFVLAVVLSGLWNLVPALGRGVWAVTVWWWTIARPAGNKAIGGMFRALFPKRAWSRRTPRRVAG